jgi:hypothetical protein
MDDDDDSEPQFICPIWRLSFCFMQKSILQIQQPRTSTSNFSDNLQSQEPWHLRLGSTPRDATRRATLPGRHHR